MRYNYLTVKANTKQANRRNTMINFKRSGPMSNRIEQATAPNGDLYTILTIRNVGKVPYYDIYKGEALVHAEGAMGDAKRWILADIKANNRF
jgi:hypothetical protein